MKKFIVSEECNACGRCIQKTDLMIEQPDGKATPSGTGYISDDFLSNAQEIIDVCPVKAISIIESSNIKTTGKEGLKELAQLLIVKLHEIDIPAVTENDIKFDSNNYMIDFADQRGGHEYIYSSEAQAQKAALNEFDRIAYSQCGPFILSVLLQYKNDKLRQFYIFESNEDSFYHRINKRIEAIFKEIATEARSLMNDKLSLPTDFDRFEAYPTNSNEFVKARINARLGEFEARDDRTSKVMKEYKQNSPYSSLDSYKMYIDTDDMEFSDGQGLFGKEKYKTKYCHRGVTNAVIEYLKDLRSAMNYSDIDEDAFRDVNEAVNEYKKEVAKAIEVKINAFSEVIAQLD
jgi:ferredoxin